MTRHAAQHRLDTTRTHSFWTSAIPVVVLGALAPTLTPVAATAAESTERPSPLRNASPRVPVTELQPNGEHTVLPSEHTVEPGETIWGIAQRFELPTADLLAWNGLDATSIIYPGDVLRLIAPAAAEPAPAPEPAAVEAPPADIVGVTHTVAPGDTLFSIAATYGTTVDALLVLNGLGADAIIYPGQVIQITAFAAAPAPEPAPSPAGVSVDEAALSAEQAENAALIIGIGRELGVSDRGIAIALATSMVESWMRNLDWGDRDSLGLFQQRPSTGWGSPEQIMDRNYSIRVFYGGPSSPNAGNTRGLLDIPGWETMGFSDAAQAVQISAYPERYGQWEAAAYHWLALHG